MICRICLIVARIIYVNIDFPYQKLSIHEFCQKAKPSDCIEQQLVLQLFLHSRLILTRFVTKSDDHKVDFFKLWYTFSFFLVDLFVFILFYYVLVIVICKSYFIRTPPPSRVSISIIGNRETHKSMIFFFFIHLYRFHGFCNSYANPIILPKLTRSNRRPTRL